MKPELLDDEKAAGLSHEAWRLFVSLILMADDYGNLRANEKKIDGAVFWARECPRPVEVVIQEIADAGLIKLYTVREQRYASIINWAKHQKVDHPGKPLVPGPEEAEEYPREWSPRETLANGSRMARESFAPDQDQDQDQDQRSGPTTNDQDQRTSDAPAKPTRRRRRSAIPEGWRPSSDTLHWCRTEMRVEGEAHVEEFVEYWLSDGGTKANWDLTFKNRIRELKRQGRAKASSRPVNASSPPERTATPPVSPEPPEPPLTPEELEERKALFREFEKSLIGGRKRPAA